MWLFTRYGFFSVVQKEDSDVLTIRAQVKSDLDRLRRYVLPTLAQATSHGGTNYPWRATAGKADFGEAAKRMAEDISYAGFTDEVALGLGKNRAQRIGKVWTPLADMPDDLPEEDSIGPLDRLPLDWNFKTTQKVAYGGVLIGTDGRLLLREVANHYDGYVWTFPKGRPDPGEAPRQTALREVDEETGVDARILMPIPGEFAGGTTINRYFLMTVDERAVKLDFVCDETASLRWAWPQEARELIAYTSNKLGRKRDLAVLEAALACLPNPPPLKRPVARREDWNRKPMPAARKRLTMDKVYSTAEMARIARGFIPSCMEEKWFIYFEDGKLFLHRSWTGLCIYCVEFLPVATGWAVAAVWANRHPQQYEETDDVQDARTLLEMIEIHLTRGPDEPTVDSMVLAFQQAFQPNYLGSPKVVSDLLEPFFALAIEQQKGMATYDQVLQENLRISNALTTGEGGYTVMPGWHTAASLGQTIVKAFELDPDYYADENLLCIVSEGLSAVSIKINELLKAFQQDTNAKWLENALPQLNRLHAFVCTVMLGTNGLQFQNLTLKDFAWQKTTVVRKPPINLTSLGIAPGAQLDFVEDSEALDEVSTHCIVTDNNKVIYAGEMLSLSAAALKVLHASGAKTKAVNGALYWAYKGETLAARRLRLQG
ncbi:MAG: NUDIX domain-containing protein [Ilumatobacteraceae bacterium]|jgi:8-oxo-dGTP pyrophosphatase MutT (NUDIX family)|nr:NUDIX domain-containing protein [Ilumatobacteraceae bacterium]